MGLFTVREIGVPSFFAGQKNSLERTHKLLTYIKKQVLLKVNQRQYLRVT